MENKSEIEKILEFWENIEKKSILNSGTVKEV